MVADFNNTPEDLLEVALSLADGTENLTPENRAALGELVRYIREHPERAKAVAIEKQLAFLLLKQAHEATLAAIRNSNLSWIEQWHLQKGEPIKRVQPPQATPTPSLLPRPMRRPAKRRNAQ